MGAGAIHQDFYHRLSMCFGHIAHCDRATFYATWFTRDQDRLRFLEKTLKWPCWGDLDYTFSMSSAPFSRRCASGITWPATNCAWPKRSGREMETLRRLETKYRVPANRTDDAGAITVDLAVVDIVARQPGHLDTRSPVCTAPRRNA